MKGALTRQGIAERLVQSVCAAGGVTSWIVSRGLGKKARGNIQNMFTGALPVTESTVKLLGYTRHDLQIYLPDGETLPKDLQPFSVARYVPPGRAKTKTT